MEITLVTDQNQKFFLPFFRNQQEIERQDLIWGAVSDGTACGVLCVKEKFGLLYVQDIYVADDFRRKGIGTKLLDTLNQYGIHYAYEGAAIEYISTKENQSFSNFLGNCLFELQTPSDTIYSIQLKDISISVLGKQILLQETQLISLNKTTNKDWNQFLDKMRVANELDEQGIVPYIKPKDAYEGKISFLFVKNRDCCGAILFSRHDEMYLLDYFTGFHSINPLETIAILQMAFGEIEKVVPQETRIRMNTLTEVTEKLIMKLSCGKAKVVGQAVCRYYPY